mgnify:CR=1 FL=1
MMKEKREGTVMQCENETIVIPVRLNARELRELEEQVEKSGLSREEFMRSLILGAQVHAKPCEHHPELLRKIAGLCNNANQLAHVANASGMASEQSVQEMLRLTKETWHLVKGRVVMTDGLYKCYPRPPPGPFYRICERPKKKPHRKQTLWRLPLIMP